MVCVLSLHILILSPQSSLCKTNRTTATVCNFILQATQGYSAHCDWSGGVIGHSNRSQQFRHQGGDRRCAVIFPKTSFPPHWQPGQISYRQRVESECKKQYMPDVSIKAGGLRKRASKVRSTKSFRSLSLSLSLCLYVT